jgi:DNA-binding PucR family transcriptional regulator
VPSVLVAFLLKVTDPATTPPLVRQLASVVEQHCSIYRANISCMSIGPIVYVLFPAVREADFPLRLAHAAASAVESRLGHGVYAAISSPAVGAEHLAELRHEAEEVLGVLSSASHFADVAGAGAADIQAQLLLLHLERELRDKPRLRHPGVSALIDHDRAQGSDYRASLCAYFAAIGDIGAAAKHLNVHPNTLRYRIKRAETLFGLRLDRADDQLAIWIQLRLAGDGRVAEPRRSA